MQVNPPKMERFEDVSNMTYLNEAAVLWNLKSRYVAKLIYVSTHPHMNTYTFESDLFWPLLCGDQPLQAVSHLYGENLPNVSEVLLSLHFHFNFSIKTSPFSRYIGKRRNEVRYDGFC